MKRCAVGGSIRARMMFLVLAVASGILAAVILKSYWDARWRLEADMEARALSLAESAAHQIDAQLGGFQGLVQGLAMALEAQQLGLPFAQAREMQDLGLREHPGLYGICIALEPEWAPADWPDLAPWAYRTPTGLAYADLSGPRHAHTLEDWYNLPKHLGRPVWSEPYEWAGVLMVTFSTPFYLDGPNEPRFAGVVTCDLTLEWLEQTIAALPLGPGGYGLLMSRNGTYISHPLPEIVLRETVFSIAEARGDPGLRAIGQRMVSGQPGILPFHSFVHHDLSWLAFTPLHSADWIMAALISRAEMKAEILRLAHRQGLIGLGGLLLLWLAIAAIARSITRPIETLRTAAGQLAAGDWNTPLPSPRSRDEVADLTRAFDEMRTQLRRYIADLQETTAARERMHSELRIAHDIQLGLVPKTFPPFPKRGDLDLYAVLEPAREVGGDFYDFFPLDDCRMAFAIGDVSGKGVPAALFMAVTRSFLRSAFRTTSDPADVLNHVNTELEDGNESCMFVTLFCGVLDLRSGRLHYANAGHNPPVVRQPDGSLVWLEQPSGPVAGPMAGMTYRLGEYDLKPGAACVLYTDGITEAMNGELELYGTERLAHFLQARPRPEGCRSLIEALVADVRAFVDGAEPSDDITLLVLARLEADAPHTPRLDLLVRAELPDLERALDELERFLQAQGTLPDTIFGMRLAFEELGTNIIKYAYDDASGQTFTAALILTQPPVLTLTDNGRPFHPLAEAPIPPLEAPLEDRPIGGLGLHMLRSMGLKLAYHRADTRNILEITFPSTPAP